MYFQPVSLHYFLCNSISKNVGMQIVYYSCLSTFFVLPSLLSYFLNFNCFLYSFGINFFWILSSTKGTVAERHGQGLIALQHSYCMIEGVSI